MHHKAKRHCSWREPNFLTPQDQPTLGNLSFSKIFLFPLQNGHNDAWKDHMESYRVKGPSLLLLSQCGGPGHCLETWINYMCYYKAGVWAS